MGDVMEWQDISTAPRDGTDLLVANSRVFGGHMTVVSFYEEDDGRQFWLSQEMESYQIDTFTHWMPLPTPPSSPPTPTPSEAQKGS